MKRLFWIGVGAAAAVVVIRRSRDLVEAHTPPGVVQAVGIVGGLGGAIRSARAEFTAGLAEREADLRHGLLGDVDLDEARTRTDAWRADRADRAGSTSPGRASSGSRRRGRHSDPRTQDQPQAQDPSDDDGDLGYSFY